jgi:hypothetical protein
MEVWPVTTGNLTAEPGIGRIDEKPKGSQAWTPILKGEQSSD